MNGSTTTECGLSHSSASSFTKLARRVIFTILGKLHFGQIVLYEGDESFIFGSDSSLQARVTVHSPRFYPKVLFSGSIGAGEAYIDQLWDVDDLTKLVRIMILNMELLDKIDSGFSWLLLPFKKLAHSLRSNTRKGAKENIIAHYDLGNELYRSFLDPSMMYSSAIFPEKSSDLDEAAAHKLDVICKKLNLKESDQVIEIGTGWGGFAIHAAKNYGCHVTTTTISDAQYEEARKRIQAAGLSDKITLIQQDYRDLTGKYDKLVSIEMIEAVGARYLSDFFQKCGQLVRKNGVMLIQAITIRDQKFNQYARSVDFIQRHIFPGGCLPSNRKMIDFICDRTDMVVRSIEDYGSHYARTLREWRKRFITNFHTLHEHGFDERFRRLWEFYLCYCEGGFLEKSISVVQLVAARPAHREEIAMVRAD